VGKSMKYIIISTFVLFFSVDSFSKFAYKDKDAESASLYSFIETIQEAEKSDTKKLRRLRDLMATNVERVEQVQESSDENLESVSSAGESLEDHKVFYEQLFNSFDISENKKKQLAKSIQSSTSQLSSQAISGLTEGEEMKFDVDKKAGLSIVATIVSNENDKLSMKQSIKVNPTQFRKTLDIDNKELSDDQIKALVDGVNTDSKAIVESLKLNAQQKKDLQSKMASLKSLQTELGKPVVISYEKLDDEKDFAKVFQQAFEEKFLLGEKSKTPFAKLQKELMEKYDSDKSKSLVQGLEDIKQDLESSKDPAKLRMAQRKLAAVKARLDAGKGGEESCDVIQELFLNDDGQKDKTKADFPELVKNCDELRESYACVFDDSCEEEVATKDETKKADTDQKNKDLAFMGILQAVCQGYLQKSAAPSNNPGVEQIMTIAGETVVKAREEFTKTVNNSLKVADQAGSGQCGAVIAAFGNYKDANLHEAKAFGGDDGAFEEIVEEYENNEASEAKKTAIERAQARRNNLKKELACANRYLAKLSTAPATLIGSSGGMPLAVHATDENDRGFVNILNLQGNITNLLSSLTSSLRTRLNAVSSEITALSTRSAPRGSSRSRSSAGLATNAGATSISVDAARRRSTRRNSTRRISPVRSPGSVETQALPPGVQRGLPTSVPENSGSSSLGL